MSDIRKETVGLGCYSKHAWIDEDPTRLEQCPWCEIERLRAIIGVPPQKLEPHDGLKSLKGDLVAQFELPSSTCPRPR